MSEITQAFGTIEALKGALRGNVVINDFMLDGVIGGVALGSLLEDGRPGTGKTLTAKTLAVAMGGEYGRVQGAPDKMPQDFVGTQYWDLADSTMKFKPGPLLTSNVFLADELNRNSPKTQSALLEVMGEGQATVDNTAYEVRDPLTIFGTHNPRAISEGTNPLVEADLDRFAVGVTASQTRTEEKSIIVKQRLKNQQPTTIKAEPVTDLTAVTNLRKVIGQINLGDEQVERIIDTIAAVEKQAGVDPEASILHGRAKLHMADMAAYLAISAAKGSQTVDNTHIDEAAKYVLPHRIGLTYQGDEAGLTGLSIVTQTLAKRR